MVLYVKCYEKDLRCVERVRTIFETKYKKYDLRIHIDTWMSGLDVSSMESDPIINVMKDMLTKYLKVVLEYESNR